MGNDGFDFEEFSPKDAADAAAAAASEDALRRQRGTVPVEEAIPEDQGSLVSDPPPAADPPAPLEPFAVRAVDLGPTFAVPPPVDAPRPTTTASTGGGAGVDNRGWREVPQAASSAFFTPAWMGDPASEPEILEEPRRSSSRLVAGLALVLAALVAAGVMVAQSVASHHALALAGANANQHPGGANGGPHSASAAAPTPLAQGPGHSTTVVPVTVTASPPAAAPVDQAPVQQPQGGDPTPPPPAPTEPPPAPKLVVESHSGTLASAPDCPQAALVTTWHCHYAFTTLAAGPITVTLTPVGSGKNFTAISGPVWNNLLYYPTAGGGNGPPPATIEGRSGSVTMTIQEPPGTYGTGLLAADQSESEGFTITIWHY